MELVALDAAAASRRSTPFPLDPEIVGSLLDLTERPNDALFVAAFESRYWA